MRNVVVQSYRNDAPEWLQRCMQSVRQWTQSQGYDYLFVDDRLFDYVPSHIRANPPSSILPLTDLARLGLLKEQLAKGYDRAIWIDADVLVFRPEQFRIPKDKGAMLCHEVWTHIDSQDVVQHQTRVNNAVMVFERGHPLLDFLHHAALELFSHIAPERMHPWTIGTEFFTNLSRLYPVYLLTQVACLSPLLIDALCTGKQPELLHDHAKHFGHPFHAANLCRSSTTDNPQGTDVHIPGPASATKMDQLVEILAARSKMSIHRV
jgi:hypothetical protein